MTAICCRCGMLLNAPEDPVLDEGRDLRSLNQLGIAMAQHLQQSHQELLTDIANLTMQFSGWSVLAHFESADQRFRALREESRAALAALFSADSPSPAKKVVA
ncbi:MAG TPA: hypothetical protein VFW83_02615 [Bryobacteraceae bacterium]|nr:hypothetical protein [Bryobacteraceae bacterium]